MKSAVDSSSKGKLSFRARHANTYLSSALHPCIVQHIGPSPTNLVHRALSSINVIIVESVQVSPDLDQLLTIAPRRDNKSRVRLHSS